MNPMKVTQYSFQPFEDINKNGFYDGSDVPSPVDIPSAEVDIYKEVFDPRELGVGFDYKYKDPLNICIPRYFIDVNYIYNIDNFFT